MKITAWALLYTFLQTGIDGSTLVIGSPTEETSTRFCISLYRPTLAQVSAVLQNPCANGLGEFSGVIRGPVVCQQNRMSGRGEAPYPSRNCFRPVEPRYNDPNEARSEF